MKKPIVLSFRFAGARETVVTAEGAVTAQRGDAILTGTKGEMWPIMRSKFEASYEYDAAAGTCAKKPLVVDVEQMGAPFEVKVGWSDQPIKGMAGDYRVTYGPGDFGVVAQDIFRDTYTVVED